MGVKFDFFNDGKDEWLKAFCQYFKLDKDAVFLYFMRKNPDNLTQCKLISDLNIDLNAYQSSEVEIVCRHMTTASDSYADSYKNIGVLDLRTMLQTKTQLSEFIKRYGVTVDVDQKIFSLDGKKYPITSVGEECDYCFEGRAKPCNNYFKCEVRKSMDILGLKLYKYSATVEFFMHATLEQISRYSSIRRCPEILQTLDKILSALNGYSTSAYKMSYDWMKESTKCFLIEFPIGLHEMETYSPIDYEGAWSEIGDCLEKSGFSRYEYLTHKIPQNVFDNMVFLKWFVSIYFYDSEEMGSLLPGCCVLPDKLKCIEVN
ncbi:hypothetical protein [Sinanaerobacter chloroacetimidivorans]|uniref:Uncharacterized protein n=1 Tax=Sinanaerobacter chloroacetimidivorans TaxID=2818044 RepID=A0A8J8B0C0_9FIRM|nr:hypothetical protein [Sinanaerobacter chloroacetimidivorans]MBR0596456.1 hypothetical protein [Sinanaerobacter chloroacetimidivorans]